jgi:hypothetical protein
MELASMLAGQRFTDHPATVSPVIGAFLRGYNDGLDDELRQTLKRYAAESLETAADPETEDWRRRMVAEQVSGVFRRRLMTAWIVASAASDDTAVAYAGRAVGRKVARDDDVELHARTLELVDRLIAASDDGQSSASASMTPLRAADTSASWSRPARCA